MDIPTKEQVREFWQWIGWEFSKDGRYYRLNPKASGWGVVKYLPPLDLNNLFKYGLPKVREILGANELSNKLQGWINDVIQCGLDPSSSLFWIIYKILGESEGDD